MDLLSSLVHSLTPLWSKFERISAPDSLPVSRKLRGDQSDDGQQCSIAGRRTDNHTGLAQVHSMHSHPGFADPNHTETSAALKTLLAG